MVGVFEQRAALSGGRCILLALLAFFLLSNKMLRHNLQEFATLGEDVVFPPVLTSFESSAPPFRKPSRIIFCMALSSGIPFA